MLEAPRGVANRVWNTLETMPPDFYLRHPRMTRKLLHSPWSLLLIWSLASLLRVIGLALHYVCPDPYGTPMVARIDRFLPFHALVELGALAQVLLPFAILAIWKPRLAIRSAWIATGIYLLYGQFDLEVLRFFRQHATLSYLTCYLRPQAVFDSTTLLALQIDPVGLGRSAMLGLVGLAIGILAGKASRPTASNPWQIPLLLTIGLVLGTSPRWLNHTTNRTERILPPTYVLVRDLAAMGLGEIAPVSDADALASLRRLGLRSSDSLEWSPPGYPLLRARRELACSRGWTSAGCLLDADRDGHNRLTDCDDLDSSTHPGAQDMPSDGLDQDCSGMDRDPVNIVLVVVESWNRDAVLQELSIPGRLPNLRRLEAMGGPLYLRGRSNGFPSVYGIASTFLGIWSHPHRNLFTSSTGNLLRGFPEYLPKETFARMAFSGADPTFDNQMPWLRRWFETVRFDPNNGNDAADSIIVDQMLEELSRIPSSKPWFTFLATHNTHAPFHAPASYRPDMPRNTAPERFANALDYFDHQLGRLLDSLERREDFSRTVFLMVGDHGFPVLPRDLDRPEGISPERSATLVGLFSPNPRLRLPSGRIDAVASQLDIGPTILGLLGIRDIHHFQGRDLRDTSGRSSLFFKDGSWEFEDRTHDLHACGPDDTPWAHNPDGSWIPWTDPGIPHDIAIVSRLTARKIWVDSVDGRAYRSHPSDSLR